MNEYWLRRIDAHLDRANELFERNERAFERFVAADDRNTAAFDRNTEAFDRNTEAFDRNAEAFDRNAEAFDRNAEAFDRNAEAFNRNTEAFHQWRAQQQDYHEFMRELTLRVERTGREHTRMIRQLSDEFVTEMRAQRGALLAILDRLTPGDSGSAA